MNEADKTYSALGAYAVEAARQLGFDAAYAVGAEGGISGTDLEKCRRTMTAHPTRITVLPFGASQTAGAGELKLVEYVMLIVDRAEQVAERTEESFNTLCKALARAIHRTLINDGENYVFVSKWNLIYNEMTIETSTRRIHIVKEEGVNTAMFSLWLTDARQYALPPTPIPVQSVGGDDRTPLTSDFAAAWKDE